jgi:hypothetical protein
VARIRLGVPFRFHKIPAIQDGTSGLDPTLVSLNPAVCDRIYGPDLMERTPSVDLILIAHLESNGVIHYAVSR